MTIGYRPSSAVVNSTIAPCAGARSTACAPQLPSLPFSSRTPSLITVSKIVPTTWKELSIDGPAFEHEDPDRLAGADLDRRVDVLVGDAVEDHEVGSRRRGHGLGEVGRLALLAEVPLALDDRELVVDGRQAFLGLDDDHAVHAVGDVVERRARAAVVHPHAGVVGGPLVDLLLARAIEVISSFQATWLAWKSIECDSWFSAGFVRWTRIVSPTLTRMTGPGHGATERPDLLDETRGDGHLLLGHDQVDVVDLPSRRGAVGSWVTGAGAFGSAATSVSAAGRRGRPSAGASVGAARPRR